MKLTGFISVVLFFGAGLFPGVCRAEMLKLGGISEQSYLKELPDKISLDIDGTAYVLAKSDVQKWLNEKTDLAYYPSYSGEIENGNFCSYKKSMACALAFLAKDGSHIKKTSELEADTGAIDAFVSDLSKEADRAPENAKLKIDTGKASVFSLSQPGIELDKGKSAEIIEDYLAGKNHPEKIQLVFKEIQPEITTDSIDNLGITSLIGEGMSDFRGSPKNRIYNIEVALKKFDGLLLKPNEEFSFTGTLGEVDGEHGYLPELVIKGDKTEPDYGGGICQVSTTVFRTAINSGLKITARTNHAYPVGYYNPQGTDATVYVPRPDLRFVNNTPGYVLMQSRIEGTRLIFDFYGTSDGRKVNMIGPKITERNPDGSMKTTFTQQVLDKDGNILREDVFNSNYDSPSKYPHPGDSTTLTKKPKDWSKKQWDEYQKIH